MSFETNEQHQHILVLHSAEDTLHQSDAGVVQTDPVMTEIRFSIVCLFTDTAYPSWMKIN